MTFQLSLIIPKTRDLLPGILLAFMVALAAQFLSDHYQVPAMLMALLLGIALNFASSAEAASANGINFSSKSLLRIGVALLGVRIGIDTLFILGAPMVAMVVAAMLATIGFGLLLAKLFKKRLDFAFLTAGSVAICGASAAMAISAILPAKKDQDEQLIFTIIGVTVLSTIAMIIYPIIANQLSLSPLASAVFIGGAIHDVAQVVGAGFSVSPDVGDKATLVKLIRVAMLAPIVFAASLMILYFNQNKPASDEGEAKKRPPILPLFVVGFFILAMLNSFHLIPENVIAGASSISKWLLITAIAAVGMKTNIKKLLQVGRWAITLIILETLFIGAFMLAGVYALT